MAVIPGTKWTYRLVLVLCGALVVVFWFRYPSVVLYPIAALTGLAVAATVEVAVSRRGAPTRARVAASLGVGLGIGLLWTVEIAVNNVIQPGLPARDIIDNVFWAIITVALVGWSTFMAVRGERFGAGVAAGVWSGLASGAVACLSGLLLVVFGTTLLVTDPLNLLEWAERGRSSGFATLDAYVAAQTLAGAIGHLLLIGGLGGLLCGVIGSSIAIGVRSIRARTTSPLTGSAVQPADPTNRRVGG